VAPKYCGNCGAPIEAASAFCVQCGSPLAQPAPMSAAGIPGAVLPPPAQPPEVAAPPYAPPGAWPPASFPPPPKRKSRAALIAIVIVVVAVIAIIAAATLLIQPKAQFVSITKTGLSGNSMIFQVTMHTEAASIGVDKLHVNIESLQNGGTFDSVQYYNIDTIPAGRTFSWDVDVLVDPNSLSAFTYEFVLEVNGNAMDTSTVT